jgi:hypothetical protein
MNFYTRFNAETGQIRTGIYKEIPWVKHNII